MASLDPRLKVCGWTRPAQLGDAALLGIRLDYVGIILWAGSPRSVTDPPRVAALAEAARAAGAQPVGVFVDADEERLRATAESAGLAVLQLHGSEPPELVARLAGAGRRCWKALRVAASPRRAPQDLFDFSTRYIDAGAEAILLDALVPGSPGGTGRTVPLELAARLAERVPLVLAGGLRPESVAAAVAAVRPWAVDVASGVERAPGDKDLDRVRAFADAARGAGGAHSRP